MRYSVIAILKSLLKISGIGFLSVHDILDLFFWLGDHLRISDKLNDY